MHQRQDEAGAAKARARVQRCPEYERLKKAVLENLKTIGAQFSRPDRGTCSAGAFYEAFGNILITLTHAAAAHGISAGNAPADSHAVTCPAAEDRPGFRLIHGGKAHRVMKN